MVNPVDQGGVGAIRHRHALRMERIHDAVGTAIIDFVVVADHLDANRRRDIHASESGAELSPKKNGGKDHRRQQDCLDLHFSVSP